MIDLFFRATNRESWNRFAEEAGLIVRNGPDRLVPLLGVDIDFIENLVHKSAIMDAGGNVTTPPVIDTAHVYINLRLTGSAERRAAALRKTFTDANDLRTVASQRRSGKTHAWLHKVFTGQGAGEVGLIEPAPEARARIWFGEPAPAGGRS